MKRLNISVRFAPKLYARMEAIARRQNRSISNFVECGMTEYVEQQEVLLPKPNGAADKHNKAARA
jgi:predicted transcriptional regulator